MHGLFHFNNQPLGRDRIRNPPRKFNVVDKVGDLIRMYGKQVYASGNLAKEYLSLISGPLFAKPLLLSQEYQLHGVGHEERYEQNEKERRGMFFI